MQTKRCNRCREYSFALGRCSKGKANPVSKQGTQATASLMGWSYICLWNKWKQETAFGHILSYDTGTRLTYE